MKIILSILRLFRLPFDFLLLTFHYVKGMVWLIFISIKRMLGLKTQSWPYGCFTQVTSHGRCACIPGRKYGNLFLFRSLCPDASRFAEMGGETYCTEKLQITQSFWRPPLGRLVGVGLFLIIMWSTIGYGVYQLLPATQKMKKAKSENFLLMGQKLVAEEKYNQAILAYQNAIKHEPKNANIYFEFGKCLIKMGRPTEGLGKLQHSVKLNPKFDEAHLELARIFNQPGYHNLCELHAEKALAINPENRESHLLLASALTRQNKKEEAAKAIKNILKIPNLSSEEYYQTGELYSLIQKLDAADECMQKALELDPNNVQARVGLAYVLIQEEKWDAAREQVDKVLAQDPENLKALIGHAELLAAKKEIQAAIEEYQKIIQLHPNNPNVATRLANLLIQTNSADSGLDLLQKVADYYPQHPGANSSLLEMYFKQRRYRLAIEYANRILAIPDANNDYAKKLLGRSYISTKRYDLAVKTLQEVVEKFPDDFDSKIALAYAYHYNGEVENAIECYHKASELNPESNLPFQFLGLLYAQQNRLDDAIEKYREGMKKSSDDRTTVNNLAMLLIERGNEEDLDEAYKLTQKLIEEHSNNAVIADTMGWLLYHRGDYNKAKIELERAIEIDSYLPDSHYHLGKVFLKQDNPQQAIKELEQSLKLSTSFRGAKDAHELLKGLLEKEKQETDDKKAVESEETENKAE